MRRLLPSGDQPGDQLDVERAAEMIRMCKDANTVREIRDQARTIETWQRTRRASLEAQNDAAEIAIRAERRLGEMCSTVAKRGQPKKEEMSTRTTLSDLGISRDQSSRWQKLATAPQDVFEQHIVATRAKCERLTTSGTIAAVSHATDYESDEWYTPPEYIQAVRGALGGIDLDPASNPIAQRTVQATRYFAKDHDGLAQEWRGRVFLNPPYSNPLGTDFVVKLCEEYEAGRVTEAILLQNAGTGTIWFHRVGQSCSAMCFTRKRIGFLRSDGTRHDGNRYAQVFCYFGPDPMHFADVFQGHGLIVQPERRAA